MQNTKCLLAGPLRRSFSEASRQNKIQSTGFTFVELLIYIVIVVLISGVIAQTFIFIITANQKITARKIVDENLDFALGKIEQSIKKATAIDETINHLPGNTLDLTTPTDGGTTTVSYFLSVDDNILKKKVGESDPIDITSDKVIVSAGDTYLFSKAENPSTKPTIQIKMKVKYNSQDPKLTSIASQIQTTVSLR